MVDAALQENLERLKRQFLSTGDSARLLQGRAELVDQFLANQTHRLPGPCALAAMGGYGRRELFPCSDIDLLFLIPEQPPPAAFVEQLSWLLRDLWDAGLRISHTVRCPQECGALQENNIEFHISMLDHRLIAGSQELYRAMADSVAKLVLRHRGALASGLYELARARRQKFHDSIYHLEPDIKETPGGMRDLHLLGWMRQLGVRREEDSPELNPACEFLHKLRCWLHFQAGRDNNLLKFELQDELASFPYLPFADPDAGMRQYYRHARAVNAAASSALSAADSPHSGLWDLFRERRVRLSNADFTVAKERVLLRSPGMLDRDAHLPFRLFEFIARHGILPAADTESRLAAHSKASLDQLRPHWPVIQPILSLPYAHRAVRVMQQTGYLMAILPEWQRIDCLTSRDFYHRYTVDEHTLVTLDNLAELAATEEPARRRFATVLSELDRPALLRLALMLHDIGKGEGGEGHAAISERLSREVMDRWQVPEEDQRLVLFLVAQHLELSSVMTKRDIEDPRTARQLAESIGTIERLRYLTVLTYADISAVNPTALSPWRMEQLWRVYLAGHREFTRELETDRITNPPAELAAFLSGFPTRYQRTHTPAQIARHRDLAEKVMTEGVGVSVERHGALYEAVVTVPDHPYLFASLAGTLASFGLSIERAEAFGNRQGLALDTFVFSDPLRTLELNPSELDRLIRMLQNAALGKLDVDKLLRGRPPRKPAPGARKIETRITVDQDASETSTLLEIAAEDRPGLLYEVARNISETECDITVVLVDTEAHRALDVFYVAHNGAKLSEDRARLLVASLRADL